MKKTFSLHEPGKADARVVEAIKHDVRRYVKRERGKTLPEGFTAWDFNCRAGADAASAVAVTLPELARAIDTVASGGGPTVYVEILAAPGYRTPAPAATPPPASAP